MVILMKQLMVMEVCWGCSGVRVNAGGVIKGWNKGSGGVGCGRACHGCGRACRGRVAGGAVTSGLAIYDTMQYVLNPVCTWCVGQAASMGSLLLAGGAPGQRHALPNARIMVHQPSGGARVRGGDLGVNQPWGWGVGMGGHGAGGDTLGCTSPGGGIGTGRGTPRGGKGDRGAHGGTTLG